MGEKKGRIDFGQIETDRTKASEEDGDDEEPMEEENVHEIDGNKKKADEVRRHFL